jgi:endoglucanase
MTKAPLRIVTLFIASAFSLCCGGDEGGGAGAPTGGSDASLANGTVAAPDGGVAPEIDASATRDASTTADAGPVVAPQPLTPFIVVDQFGYRTADEKIAVVRSPERGFDKGPFTPGAQYALVDAHSGAKLLEAAPLPWNGGAIDTSSGDKAWWFDFSIITTPGDYFVLDETANLRSPVFRIADGVYRDVLMQAVRVFYYQRDGIVKDAKYAGADWADAMQHPQDAACGRYSDGSAPKDLHGGWYDAGDQNTYTSWAAIDLLDLLRAYSENPAAFGDDYGIPESGNGVPDLLDEMKWELDWLVRMQNADGSLLSIVAHNGASPPSKDNGPCKYGTATTAASFTAASAFAYAATVYKSVSAVGTTYPGFADDLKARAPKAWTWALANPNATFFNTQHAMGGGEQEVDDAGRLFKKLQAASYLFALTGDATYKAFVDANYASQTSTVDPWHVEEFDSLFAYAKAPGATPSVAQAILSTFKAGVHGTYLTALKTNPDPYLSFLEHYYWGSNGNKADAGNMLYDVRAYGIDPSANADAMRAAERYVHYIHGLNPLQLVYLSNMQGVGATKSVTRFFHTWFAHGSKWDAVGVSQYGPPPGYLVGGPNSTYAWEGCCPSSCAGASCGGSSPPSPPVGQPDQKAYKDFNEGYPLDSWAISEPSDAYQARYVRLLSKLVQ